MSSFLRLSWEFDWAQFVATVLGSGVITTLAAMWLKRKFDRELADQTATLNVRLEHQKALLQRGLHIHERQVETLMKIRQHLGEASAYLLLMSKGAIFEEEQPDKYPAKFTLAVVSARDEFAKGRILIPPSLVKQIDTFFARLFKGQHELAWAQNPRTPNGSERAKFFERAQEISHTELPTLLQEIDASARLVIGSFDTDSPTQGVTHRAD